MIEHNITTYLSNRWFRWQITNIFTLCLLSEKIMLARLRKRTFSSNAYSETYSLTSKRSYRRGTLDAGERLSKKSFSVREYLLIFVEASLALAAYEIEEEYLEEPLVTGKEVIGVPSHRRDATTRDIAIRLLYFEGYSALVSMFVGCIADSYLSYYTVALLNVILHFGTVSVIMMEHIIKHNLEDEDYPHEILVKRICLLSLVLIKSTNFIRLVYGLQGMHTATKSVISLFIFFQFWVGPNATYGGILVNAFAGVNKQLNIDLIVLTFILNGLSLFSFVHYLHPEERFEEHIGLGCKVVSCFLLGIYRNIFRYEQQSEAGFLEKTLGICNEKTIFKTRKLIKLFFVLLSTIGMAFYIEVPTELFVDFNNIKTAKMIEAFGVLRLVRVTYSIGMLISYFVLWPLVALIKGIRKKKHIAFKFLMGYLIATVSEFYRAGVAKSIEKFPYSSTISYVRIFNTRGSPVEVIHREHDVITHDVMIAPLTGVILSYHNQRLQLIPVEILFNGTGSNRNFTTFISGVPGELTGYMILEPPQIVSIRGFLPLREGPKGTNKGSWPRIYIYNTALTLYGAWIEIKYSNQRKIISRVQIQQGTSTVIALEPATYDVSIPKADIVRIITVHQGGLYGMMIYSASTVREMAIDTVTGENTASLWPYICHSFMGGLALGISYPSLRTAIFLNAPDGLMGMSFATLTFLEGISLWIIYIGFKTWHRFVTSNDLFVYSSLIAVNFLMCMFFYLKNKTKLEQ